MDNQNALLLPARRRHDYYTGDGGAAAELDQHYSRHEKAFVVVPKPLEDTIATNRQDVNVVEKRHDSNGSNNIISAGRRRKGKKGGDRVGRGGLRLAGSSKQPTSDGNNNNRNNNNRDHHQRKKEETDNINIGNDEFDFYNSNNGDEEEEERDDDFAKLDVVVHDGMDHGNTQPSISGITSKRNRNKPSSDDDDNDDEDDTDKVDVNVDHEGDDTEPSKDEVIMRESMAAARRNNNIGFEEGPSIPQEDNKMSYARKKGNDKSRTVQEAPSHDIWNTPSNQQSASMAHGKFAARRNSNKRNSFVGDSISPPAPRHATNSDATDRKSDDDDDKSRAHDDHMESNDNSSNKRPSRNSEIAARRNSNRRRQSFDRNSPPTTVATASDHRYWLVLEQSNIKQNLK
jgi:hypothetical protein